MGEFSGISWFIYCFKKVSCCLSRGWIIDC